MNSIAWNGPLMQSSTSYLLSGCYHSTTSNYTPVATENRQSWARMDNSPFNNLPREIRDLIYGYALTSLRDIEMCAGAGVGYMRLGMCAHYDKHLCVKQMLEGFPTTCRQIREESLPIFFSSNRFRASGWDSNRHISRAAETMLHWTRDAFRFKYTIPPSHWALVHRLTFDMGVWKTEYMDRLNWTNIWQQVRKIGTDMHPEAKFNVELFVYLQNLGDLYIELSVPFGDAEKAKAEVDSVLDRIRNHIKKHPYEEEVIAEGVGYLEENREKLKEVFDKFPAVL